jgi:hypothetical protein
MAPSGYSRLQETPLLSRKERKRSEFHLIESPEPLPSPTEGTVLPGGVDVRVDGGLETQNDTPVVDGTTARDTPRGDVDSEVTGGHPP